MEMCQQLFQNLLGSTQGNWWDYVLPKLFRFIHKTPDNQLTFVEFITILSTVMKGSLEEKFRLCFQLCDSDVDNQVTNEELDKLLKLLHGMCTKEDTDTVYTDFLDMIRTKADKEEGALLNLDELITMIIHKPLLASFWNLSLGDETGSKTRS